jgi:hypothetical protein
MRLITWNFARRSRDTWQAGVMLERIRDDAPDIIVLTDAHATSLALLGGHVVADTGVRWARNETETERKVLLWSGRPWREITHYPTLSALGAAVSGVTQTPMGNVRVLAVCTPPHFAWPDGLVPRPLFWEQHIAYLDALRGVLDTIPTGPPLIIAGSFNQPIPLAWGSWTAHHRLMATLSGVHILTRGDIAPIGAQTLDHIAAVSSLRAGARHAISNLGSDGKEIAEYFGVVADLEPGGVAIFD